MYESPVNIIEMEPDVTLLDVSKQMAKDFDDAVTMEIQRMYHVDVDTDELAKALKYDREQYEKGFVDGKNDVIQRLLKTDGCELCSACIHSDNYLHSSPCSKCKHSYPATGDNYYFVLKEE